MIVADEDALICDFAETYHVFDWRMLPVKTAATLACGLREDSRIKRHLSGARFGYDTMLLAAIADRMSIMVWQNTKDGQKGRNRPKMILDSMTEKKEQSQIVAYSSADEYLAARAKIVEEIQNGGH